MTNSRNERLLTAWRSAGRGIHIATVLWVVLVGVSIALHFITGNTLLFSMVLHLVLLLAGVGLMLSALVAARRKSSWVADAAESYHDEIISLREQLEGKTRELRETEADLIQARAALDDASDAIMILDHGGSVYYVNMAFGLRFSITNDQLQSFDWLSIFEDKQAAKEAFLTAGTGQNIKMEFNLQCRSGEQFPASISLTQVMDDNFETLGILFIIADITEQKKLENSLKELAMLDGLTGIYNRRSFEQRLEEEWRRALRAGTPLSLIMIDIDHFKAYNDTYGHQQGDECLRKVAKTLAEVPNRPFDFVARYGGEEFVCLLPETPEPGALEIAEQLRASVENLALPHRQSSVSEVVTISVGVSTCVPDDGISIDSLCESADAALYGAKDKGRNQVSAGKSENTGDMPPVPPASKTVN